MVQIGRGHRINELPNASLPFYADIDTMLEEVLAGKDVTPHAQLNAIDSGMLASACELYGIPRERTSRSILTDANVVAYGGGRDKLYLPSPQVITDYFRKGQHITAVGSRVGLEAVRLDAGLQVVVSRMLPKGHREFDALHETLQGVVENAYGAGQWRKGQYLRSNTPLLAGLAVQQAGIRQLPHVAYRSLRLFSEEWEKYGLRAPTDYPPVLGRLAIGIRAMNTESTTEVLVKALRNENDIHARRTIGQTIVLRHGEAILKLAGAFAEELPSSPLKFKTVEMNANSQPNAGQERIRTSHEYAAPRSQEAPPARPTPEARTGRPSVYDVAVLQEPGVLMARVVQALGEGNDNALLVATMALGEQYNIGVPTALQVYPSLWKHQRLHLFNYVYGNKERISEGRVTPAEARFIKTIHNEVQSPVSNRLYAALQTAAARTYNLRLVAKPFKELATEAFVYNHLTAKATYAVQSEKDRLLLARLQARRATEIEKLSKVVDRAGFKGQRSFLPPEVTAAVEDAKRRPQELKRTETAFRRLG